MVARNLGVVGLWGDNSWYRLNRGASRMLTILSHEDVRKALAPPFTRRLDGTGRACFAVWLLLHFAPC